IFQPSMSSWVTLMNWTSLVMGLSIELKRVITVSLAGSGFGGAATAGVAGLSHGVLISSTSLIQTTAFCDEASSGFTGPLSTMRSRFKATIGSAFGPPSHDTSCDVQLVEPSSIEPLEAFLLPSSQYRRDSR